MKNTLAKTISFISLNVTLLIISANVQIPLALPITLQLLAVFIICGAFNFKISCASITLYVLGGLIGLPFFSGFSGTVAVLSTPNGGFIIGFLLVPYINLCLYNIKNIKLKLILFYSISLFILYLLGFIWYGYVIHDFYFAFNSLILFLPIDLIKCIICYKITIYLYKTYL